jgi:hypothetical protein
MALAEAIWTRSLKEVEAPAATSGAGPGVVDGDVFRGVSRGGETAARAGGGAMLEPEDVWVEPPGLRARPSAICKPALAHTSLITFDM